MKNNTFFIKYLAIIACFLSVSACQKSKDSKTTNTAVVSATDARGKEVSLEKEAQRVIVLFEPMVDEVFMLQANEKLVGIPDQIYQTQSTFDYLSKIDARLAKKEIASPTFGGRANNMESIIGLSPDLVIVYDQDKETIQQLEELNIPVFVVSSLNKERIYNELKGVARLLGKEERADKIIKIVEENLSDMKAPEGINPKKVYYGWSKGRVLSTSGKGTLIDLAIELAGAVNACSLDMEAPNVGAETLYDWNPDLIVLWNSVPEDVYGLKELGALPAVKNKAVRILSPTFNFDPHTVKFMLFAKQIHQWCYGGVNDEETLKQEAEEILAQLYH